MFRPWYKNLDFSILIVWLALVCIGLTAIYSATHGPGSEFLLESVQRNFDRQLQWFGVSVVLMTTILLLPAGLVGSLAYPAYGFMVLLIMLTAFTPLGREINGAKAWLYIGPVGLQVAEFAKVATVLAVAKVLSGKEARTGKPRYLVLAGALLLAPVPLIVFGQNDTGTALVFVALAPILLFWTGFVPLPVMALIFAPAVAVYLAIVNIAAALVFAVLFTGFMVWLARNTDRRGLITGLAFVSTAGVAIAAWFGLTKILQPHQIGRLVAFKNPEAYALTEGYHIIQAKAAIGSGGLFGKGFMNGTQTQLAFIPEQSTDFIFCVIGEEFGFLGALLVLMLFAFLLIRLVTLGYAAGHPFPRLFTAGVTGIFLFHILINVGMTIGVMPVIGIPLPFVSYGGTSLMANTIMVAIALSLHARKDEFGVYGT